MNANEEPVSETLGSERPIEIRLQRPYRQTARIEIPEREVRHARPLMNDETMAGQQGVLEISRSVGGTLTVLDSPAPSRGKKRESGPRNNKQLFPRAATGRLLGRAKDLEDVQADASARYRAKYAEVLREFRAGTLRGEGNRVVTERFEAKAIAADEARRFDASS